MVSIPMVPAVSAQQALQSVGAIQGMRRDALEFGSDARLADQVIGVRHHAVFGIHIGAEIRRGFDVNDFAIGVADQKIRRTAAVGLHHRQQGLVECPGIQDLAASHVERLAKSIRAVAPSYQAVDA